MNLHDIIQINTNQTSAAIVLEQGISDNALVRHYTPTQASVQVFEHFCRAVLPDATPEQRALNLYGSYGSGKSHLAVVLAQLLRDGANTPGFTQLITRLQQAGNTSLADKLKTTFLPNTDSEARPYLLVSLYASGTTSLGAKLMEGLFDALQREIKLDIKEILPSTEYDVCVKRFEEIIEQKPEYANADLSDFNLEQTHFLATEDLLSALKGHQPAALEMFSQWHKAVCLGQAFDISHAGGKNFIEAYLEAGKNLADKYHYGGIVVLWDEFGNALEDLIGNPLRIAGQEIIALQNFVERVCKPDKGHTLFVGVTHVSFQEYGDRTHASDVVKENLEKISGRFNKAFKIELNALEKDGYHLLGMQKTWTEIGRQHLSQNQPAKTKLLEVCRRLPLFQPLHEDLVQVFDDVYPLHPVMAVGLFNLSKLAQANRTALTFFRDNAGVILNTELNNSTLWGKELVRLPHLLDYYSDNFKRNAGANWRRYEQAINQVNGESSAEIRARKDILTLLLLFQSLGENFKANNELLSCALYDAFPNTADSEALNQHLAWLKGAGLIWKNQVTQLWTLAGEGGVDVDALIEKGTGDYSGRSLEYLLETYTEMQEDILPVLGNHNLEPSPAGIIRSYSVSLLPPSFTPEQVKRKDKLLSAHVFLLLARNVADVENAKANIQEMANSSLYFWLPVQGIESENIIENGITYNLNDLLCRYLSMNYQLSQGSALSEDLLRQLEAKWESTRNSIKDILENLYGRAGLTSAKCHIYQAGSSAPLACHSWHAFKELLNTVINGLYPKEVPIRAMNMNILSDERYSGSIKIVKLVKRVIEFNDNQAFQTDLLGENNVTSEPAALVDGILGANNLFIQRTSGLDIKKIEETDGNLNEVLKLLHDSFLRKRENPYAISELRNKLMAEPYGIPACTLPMFAAVAIRYETKRLRWGNTRETDFAKNLVDAFTIDSNLTIRLFEFSPKQLAILFLVGKALGVRQAEEMNGLDYASLSASSFREFIKNKPEGVRQSNRLDAKTRDIIRFFNIPGKSNQDLAEHLIDSLGVSAHLPSHNVSAVLEAIQDVLDDFLRVENAHLLEIKQCWNKNFPQNVDDKSRIISRIKSIVTQRTRPLLAMLEEANTADEIEPKEIIRRMLDKTFDECSDSDIGRCIGTIEMLFDQARQPEPQTIPPKPYLTGPEKYPPSTGNSPLGIAAPLPFTDPENNPHALAKKQIQNTLSLYQLQKEEIIQILEELMLENRD